MGVKYGEDTTLYTFINTCVTATAFLQHSLIETKHLFNDYNDLIAWNGVVTTTTECCFLNPPYNNDLFLVPKNQKRHFLRCLMLITVYLLNRRLHNTQFLKLLRLFVYLSCRLTLYFSISSTSFCIRGLLLPIVNKKRIFLS